MRHLLKVGMLLLAMQVVFADSRDSFEYANVNAVSSIWTISTDQLNDGDVALSTSIKRTGDCSIWLGESSRNQNFISKMIAPIELRDCLLVVWQYHDPNDYNATNSIVQVDDSRGWPYSLYIGKASIDNVRFRVNSNSNNYANVATIGQDVVYHNGWNKIEIAFSRVDGTVQADLFFNSIYLGTDTTLQGLSKVQMGETYAVGVVGRAAVYDDLAILVPEDEIFPGGTVGATLDASDDFEYADDAALREVWTSQPAGVDPNLTTIITRNGSGAIILDDSELIEVTKVIDGNDLTDCELSIWQYHSANDYNSRNSGIDFVAKDGRFIRMLNYWGNGLRYRFDNTEDYTDSNMKYMEGWNEYKLRYDSYRNLTKFYFNDSYVGHYYGMSALQQVKLLKLWQTKDGCNAVFDDLVIHELTPATEDPCETAYTIYEIQDFNRDCIVNFEDYASLAAKWMQGQSN